jgi:hypothetical protein
VSTFLQHFLTKTDAFLAIQIAFSPLQKMSFASNKILSQMHALLYAKKKKTPHEMIR